MVHTPPPGEGAGGSPRSELRGRRKGNKQPTKSKRARFEMATRGRGSPALQGAAPRPNARPPTHHTSVQVRVRTVGGACGATRGPGANKQLVATRLLSPLPSSLVSGSCARGAARGPRSSLHAPVRNLRGGAWRGAREPFPSCANSPGSRKCGATGTLSRQEEKFSPRVLRKRPLAALSDPARARV